MTDERCVVCGFPPYLAPGVLHVCDPAPSSPPLPPPTYSSGCAGGSDVSQTPLQSSDLLWFGDDSQWLAAEGHVDLAAFTAAAIREAKALDYEVEEGLGSEPRHVWMRPALRSDFETDEEFARAQEDDWHQWGGVTADTPGAVPWTIVDMEW